MNLIAASSTGQGGDVAFWKNLAVLAHGYGEFVKEGFVIVDISDPTEPTQIGSFECAGSALDVSVYRDLVILSAGGEQAAALTALKGPECDALLTTRDHPDSFAGIRIVSIKNPKVPRLLASINTCQRGDPLKGEPPQPCWNSSEHTHTLLPDLGHRDERGLSNPRLIVYGNGLTETVIEVPLRDPSAARVIGQLPLGPRLIKQPELGPVFDYCHDVALFMPRDLLFCAGTGATFSLWDISEDLAKPKQISEFSNPDVNHGHGGAFSWDGNTLVLADESLPNIALSRCTAGPDSKSKEGALWFYDISDLTKSPQLKSHYQLPRAVPPPATCSVHQFNVVPLRDGRDVLVAAWFLGGTTVVDFTEPAAPFEIAHYISAPGDPKRRSNPWSSYWYKGLVYSNNFSFGSMTTERGFDVFSIEHPFVGEAIREDSFNFGLQECLPRPYGKAHGVLTTCRGADGAGNTTTDKEGDGD